MADLDFYIDIDNITKKFSDIKDELEKELKQSAENLASMTHAKTMELATENLGSLSKLYKDNLEFSNPMDNFWVVTLKEPALWVEEGRKSGFMQELLDGKSAKMGKNGKYAVIPFRHNKNPSEQSEQARNLANEIKSFLRKKNINWRKIETDSEGSPRIGKLHSFDIDSPRLKEKHKTPATYGVSVYQRRDVAGNVQKDVVTFRVISEKHRGEGLWIHPGRAGDKLMDKALDWAMDQWDREVLPAILNKYENNE